MPEAQTYRRWWRTTKREAGKPRTQIELPPVAPLGALEFVQSVYRDPAQPMALRVAMAKAAMPYVHRRADERDEESPPRPLGPHDPYGALLPSWRAALETAGLIPERHAEERR